MNRYHRQMMLQWVGEFGQSKLAHAHVCIVGCGALGTVLADTLCRAGVGVLTLIDRDVVELTNLQRQVLFDESDVLDATPKAIAAASKLARVNSGVEIRAHVADFNASNAINLASGADVLLDGLDNFQTRYLLNDLSVATHRPYVYGGAVGTTGMSCVFIPHVDCARERHAGAIDWSEEVSTPCLRCVFPESPPAGAAPTCDTVGVLGSIVGMVAHHQAIQVLKLLTGNLDAVDRSLVSIDAWSNVFQRLDVSGAFRPGTCPCCGQGRFTMLDGLSGSSVETLCGRDAVQITPARTGHAACQTGTGARIDLNALAARLNPHGAFTANAHLVRGVFASERGEYGRPIELTVFPDGRALVGGVSRVESARSIYDKYIGG